MKRAEKAFTLVELLVVISIIALLLAILMPALSKVKEQGRAIVCASNLKNYGLAMQMYASANSDRLPTQHWLYKYETLELSATCPKACRWHYDLDPPDGSMWKYLMDKNVNMCPTFRNFAMAGGPSICPNSKTGHSSRGRGGSLRFVPNYSYAINFSIAYNWGTPANSIKLSEVKRSANCIAFSEENLWTIGYQSTADLRNHLKRTGDGSRIYASSPLNDNGLWFSAKASDKNFGQDNIATYHKVSTGRCDYGMANCVFVDGHVAAIKGQPGYDAYFEYGKPYDGHGNGRNIW